MAKTKYGVFIGRFQPLHNAHLKIIKNILDEEAENLVIVVGSYRSSKSLRNPWTYKQRGEMILKALEPEYRERTTIVPARDYLYCNQTWLTGIQNAVSKVIEPGASVKLVGHFKDHSSFYLKLFPQWTLVSQPSYYGGVSSTDVRKELFSSGKVRVDLVPLTVAKKLEEYKDTVDYKVMCREQSFLEKYKSKWKNSPYPPVFVTTDAVVVQAGHVLVVRRKINPGKNMLALPGGFIGQNERIIDSCLRELKEETKILFPRENLKLYLKETHVFDHPARDLRGRTLTHACHFHIDTLGPLPSVEGADDAKEAFWMSFAEVSENEENFFSDHYYILNYFINGIGR